MAPPIVYVDATALIGLARINRLELLTLLTPSTLVTECVWQEVTVPDKLGVDALWRARDERLLVVVEEGDPDAFPELDRGESTVLSAAMANEAMVVVDERKARALIDRDPELRVGIRQVIGIVGVILLAKRQGRVGEVRPLLDELIRQSFWLSPGFYRDALREAGES